MADLADRAAVGTGPSCSAWPTGMITLAADYARERHQFGRPIGSFQAVKHLLAGAQVKLEFARPVVYGAAWSLDAGEPDRSRSASVAKAYASDAATEAARVSLQVHGAIGYTWECDLQLFLKRTWALAEAWGSAADQPGRACSPPCSTSADPAAGPAPGGYRWPVTGTPRPCRRPPGRVSGPYSGAQDRTIAAALDLFVEHGVSGTSLQMIADALGVTKAAVYHQFNTKEEIVVAAVEVRAARPGGGPRRRRGGGARAPGPRRPDGRRWCTWPSSSTGSWGPCSTTRSSSGCWRSTGPFRKFELQRRLTGPCWAGTRSPEARGAGGDDLGCHRKCRHPPVGGRPGRRRPGRPAHPPDPALPRPARLGRGGRRPWRLRRREGVDGHAVVVGGLGWAGRPVDHHRQRPGRAERVPHPPRW